MMRCCHWRARSVFDLARIPMKFVCVSELRSSYQPVTCSAGTSISGYLSRMLIACQNASCVSCAMTSARNCERIPVISGTFFNGVVHTTFVQSMFVAAGCFVAIASCCIAHTGLNARCSIPSLDHTLPKLSDCADTGTSASTFGLRYCAGATCVYAGYDVPNIPILPLHQGCFATHVCTSNPSFASWMYGSHFPCDDRSPRESTATTA